MRTITVFLLTLFWLADAVQLSPGFNPEMVWEPETALTVPPYENTLEMWSVKPKVAVTSDGSVHIVWTSFRPATPQTPQIYYKRFTPGVGWSEDTCISADLSRLVGCEVPAIACDSQDNLHIVWAEYNGLWNIWHKMRRAGGIWDSVSSSIAPGYAYKFEPVIACSPNGNVQVVWRETDNSNRRLHHYYRYRNSEGIWMPRESIPFFGCLAVNPYTGEPHICGRYFNGICRLYKSGGVWRMDTVHRPIPDEPGANLIVSGARIRYWVEQAGLVRLVVYSVLGRRVRVLAEGRKERGWYELVWDGRDESGRGLPAGDGW